MCMEKWFEEVEFYCLRPTDLTSEVEAGVIKQALHDDYGHIEDFCTSGSENGWLISVKDFLPFFFFLNTKFWDVIATMGL